MTTRVLVIAAASVCLMSPLAPHASALQQTQPAASRPAGELTVTVTAVTGIVQVRDNEDQPWRTAKAGMVVPVGGECRTGPRSSITLSMPPEQVVTLERLGTMKILEAFRQDNKLTTDLGMKYGRVHYQIEAAGVEHEAVIRGPASALAVRGTDIVKIDDALTDTVIVHKGRGFHNRHGQEIQLGTGPDDNYEPPIQLTQDDLSGAGHYLHEASSPFLTSVVLNDGEKLVVINNNTGIGLPTGVHAFPPPAQLMQPGLPTITSSDTANGALQFNLTWVGDHASGPITPDLNLFVISPRGEVLTPHNGAFSVASGGTMSPNDRGGEESSGREFALWSKSFPLGTYQYGVHYVGQGDPAIFSISVTLDGKQVNPKFTNTVSQLDRDVDFSINIKRPKTTTTAGGTPLTTGLTKYGSGTLKLTKPERRTTR